MSWLSNVFNPPNPANAGMGYLNQIPGQVGPYYQPYIGYGRNAYDLMNPVLSQMTSDPAGYMKKLMAGYAPSTQYQMDEAAMTKAAGNSAAAGGMRGSSQDINNQAQITDRLMGQDMQQWLNNAMGVQDQGLAGEGHLFDTGFEASKGYADTLANVLGSQSQLAFQGQREKNLDNQDLFSGLIKALGGAGGLLGGGGGAGLGGDLSSLYDLFSGAGMFFS